MLWIISWVGKRHNASMNVTCYMLLIKVRYTILIFLVLHDPGDVHLVLNFFCVQNFVTNHQQNLKSTQLSMTVNNLQGFSK